MKSFFLFLSLGALVLNSAIASDGVSYATCDLKIIGNRVTSFDFENGKISPFKNLEIPRMTLNFELMGSSEGQIQLKSISHLDLGLLPKRFSVKMFDDESELQKIREKHSGLKINTLRAGTLKYSTIGLGGNGDRIYFSLSGPIAYDTVASIMLPLDDNREFSLELRNNDDSELTKQLIIKCKNTNNGIFRDSHGKQPGTIKLIKNGSNSVQVE